MFGYYLAANYNFYNSLEWQYVKRFFKTDNQELEVKLSSQRKHWAYKVLHQIKNTYNFNPLLAKQFYCSFKACYQIFSHRSHVDVLKANHHFHFDEHEVVLVSLGMSSSSAQAQISGLWMSCTSPGPVGPINAGEEGDADVPARSHTEPQRWRTPQPKQGREQQCLSANNKTWHKTSSLHYTAVILRVWSRALHRIWFNKNLNTPQKL